MSQPVLFIKGHVENIEEISEPERQEEMVFQRLWDFGVRQIEALKVNDLGAKTLSGRKIVSLTSLAISQVQPRQTELLSRWVQSGGILIFLGFASPDPRLQELAGVFGPPKRLEYIPSLTSYTFESAYLRIDERQRRKEEGGKKRQKTKDEKNFDSIFDGIPESFRGNRIWGAVYKFDRISGMILAEAYDVDRETLLGPAIVRNLVGSGIVYTFNYSLGYTLLRILQGRGTKNNVSGIWEGKWATAVDQALTTREDWDYPTADFHIIPLINIIQQNLEDILILYHIPEGKRSCMMVTGDSDGVGDKTIQKYFDILHKYGLKGTVFLLSDYPHHRANYTQYDEMGVHRDLNETYQEAVNRLKAGGFEPVSAVNHCLGWLGLSEEPEKMVASGLKYSSNLETQYSNDTFGFGTALPYYFHNIYGQKIDIIEIPFLYQDNYIGAPGREFKGRKLGGTGGKKEIDKAYKDMKEYSAVGKWDIHPIYGTGIDRGLFEYLLNRISQDAEVYSDTMGNFGDWWALRDEIEVKTREGGFELKSPGIEKVAILLKQEPIWLDSNLLEPVGTLEWFGREYCWYVLNLSKGKHFVCFSPG